jgi:hypothetical protein
VTKQKLDSPEITGAPVDQGSFCTSQRVRPKQPWVQPNAADPLGNEARILARCHTAFDTTTTGEQELARTFVGDFQIVVDCWRVCSLNSNLTGRPVFFCRTVARSAVYPLAATSSTLIATTSIGFESRFRAVLCKFPVAIQKHWAQQKIIGKFPARCETVSCPKIRTILARRLNSSTRFAVLGAHGLVWVEHETLGQDPRTFQR